MNVAKILTLIIALRCRNCFLMTRLGKDWENHIELPRRSQMPENRIQIGWVRFRTYDTIPGGLYESFCLGMTCQHYLDRGQFWPIFEDQVGLYKVVCKICGMVLHIGNAGRLFPAPTCGCTSSEVIYCRGCQTAEPLPKPEELRRWALRDNLA